MQTTRHIKDHAVVIVGGTSGMGLSAAMACLNAGANVLVSGRDDSGIHKAKQALGKNAIVLPADALDSLSTPKLIDECIEAFGRFDALYHVAGGSGRRMGDGALHQITDEGWQATFDINLTSSFYSARAATQSMLKRQTSGSILLMGSVLGLSPSPEYFSTHAYAASKSALVGFVRSCAATYASSGIRFNVIAPSLVQTPMSERVMSDQQILQFVKTKQPLDGGRVGQPQDLDGAVLWLLSDESKFVTGQTIVVDGGWSLSDGQLPAQSQGGQ
ncbi:MAG TPA: short-chain dehydrogenase [Phycisphaerales bacterium]|nr:short-chain dehydrogenase [Phycisphaerales bacterium]HCD30998.1 short-chain dehydrogenase [Phycisphaerales bacterium]|tara:strand:- start:126323 stop:127141 length:819 start_codon:yes stop_codon:yes gene_type:complete